MTTSTGRRRQGPETPDLQTQLEALLDSVWDAEANGRLDDRLALAAKLRGGRKPADS